MKTETFIEENYEEMEDREIAKQLDMPESEIENIREDLGFLRIDSFSESDAAEESIEVNFEMDEMRKRQLQGFVGEKICSLMENRVMDFLENHVKDNWILRDKAQLLNIENRSHRYWVGGRPDRDEIRIQGANVKHFDAEKQEILNEIKERCLIAEEDLFEKFNEVRNPWIDFCFYAFKTSGSETKDFNCEDFSSNHLERGEKIKAEIPFVEDFKIVALEVKTTKDDEENLLSENQRKVREIARESAFIDFFTLKVETEFDEINIPESFDGKIEKHS